MTELHFINQAVENALGLAMTGEYREVRMLEEQLATDNPYARQALERGYLRAHLQELCEQACLREEQQRRAAFARWVRSMAERVPAHLPPALCRDFRAVATAGQYKRPILRLEHTAYAVEVVRFFMTHRVHLRYLFSSAGSPVHSAPARPALPALFTEITPEQLAAAVAEGHAEACRTASRLCRPDARPGDVFADA